MPEFVLAQCGHCNARYRARPAFVGLPMRCRRCRNPFYLAAKHTVDDRVLDWLLNEEDVRYIEKLCEPIGPVFYEVARPPALAGRKMPVSPRRIARHAPPTDPVAWLD